ncbi:hypothetical protein ACLB1S_22220 [Escherichia coli]
MGYIKKKSRRGTPGTGAGGDLPLEEKPFSQWGPEDLKEWTEISMLEYLDLLRNDEMDASELLDYSNCWQWEVIGDARRLNALRNRTRVICAPATRLVNAMSMTL